MFIARAVIKHLGNDSNIYPSPPAPSASLLFLSLLLLAWLQAPVVRGIYKAWEKEHCLPWLALMLCDWVPVAPLALMGLRLCSVFYSSPGYYAIFWWLGEWCLGLVLLYFQVSTSIALPRCDVWVWQERYVLTFPCFYLSTSVLKRGLLPCVAVTNVWTGVFYGLIFKMLGFY